MKLTPSQIETIELYLLSHELRDRDFYNEMLDHFIVTLEKKLDEGEDFDYAFPELTHEFVGHKYKFVSPFIYSVDGLKAMEHKFILQKIKNLRNGFAKRIIKNLNLSSLIAFFLFFCPVMLVHIFGIKNWGMKYFSVAVLLLTVAVVISLINSHKNSKSAIKSELYNSETEIEKAKQLKKMDDAYFLKSAFGLIFGAIAIFVHLTTFSKPTAMGIFLGMYSIMAFVFFRNVFVKKKVFL